MNPTRKTPPPPRRRAAGGYTLVELGIVLAVLTIIAGIMLPDFVEMARNQLAKDAAVQTSLLQDQARAYFHNTLLAGGIYLPPEEARWPGETAFNQCTELGLVGPYGPPLQEMINDSYVTAGSMTNPWGHAVRSALVPGVGVGPLASATCSVEFATDVPAVVAGVVLTYLPGSTIAGCAGAAPPAGYTRVCVRTPKPGLETSMAAAMWLVAH
jgi:type II secretory pathway pseudopilin PulG